MRKVTFFLCFFLRVFADPLDIETLPLLRLQQYSLAPYEKVIVFSPPRTGSMLTYNVMRYLFEDSQNLSCSHHQFNLQRLALKTHRFYEIQSADHVKALFVVTLRNPIDAIVSNFRICPNKPSNLRNFVQQKIQMHVDYLHFFEKLKREGNHFLFLKYEDFASSMDYLFERIETHVGIHIHEADKEIMRKGYGRENVRLSTESLANFSEYLPLSGFHGEHVLSDGYVPPKELMFWLTLLIEKVKPEFRKYGYFLD